MDARPAPLVRKRGSLNIEIKLETGFKRPENASLSPLDLLACHMLGDYALQTPWMALNKASDRPALAAHVGLYTAIHALCVAFYRDVSVSRRLLFLALLAAGHAVTDCRRWRINEGWSPGTILFDQAMHAVQSALLVRLLR